ncbi:hypothetical protein TNCV_227821 [Trichonephila clavipes]|nr:hypothetical protein TNCV_227821 [Trichonephila clavipes]
MSPIEHEWDIVGRRIARDLRPVASTDELWLRIQTIWNTLPQTGVFRNYVRTAVHWPRNIEPRSSDVDKGYPDRGLVRVRLKAKSVFMRSFETFDDGLVHSLLFSQFSLPDDILPVVSLLKFLEAEDTQR